MDQATQQRFAIMLGIAKNASTDAGRRSARQLAVNVASEAGLSFDEAFARLDEEDRLALGSRSARALPAAVDDERPLPASPSGDDDHDVGGEGEGETPPIDEDEAGGAETPPSAASAAIPFAGGSNVVIDDAVDEAQVEAAHLSTDAARDAIAAALIADPSRSDRDIARETGSSPTTVGRARSAAGLQRLVRKVTRGSSSYDMAAGREPDPTDAA